VKKIEYLKPGNECPSRNGVKLRNMIGWIEARRQTDFRRDQPFITSQQIRVNLEPAPRRRNISGRGSQQITEFKSNSDILPFQFEAAAFEPDSNATGKSDSLSEKRTFQIPIAMAENPPCSV
jgi:hypothetical protein